MTVGVRFPGNTHPRIYEDRALVEEWLTDARGKKVSVRVPKRAPAAIILRWPKRMPEPPCSGAERAEEREKVLAECAAALHLRKIPRRIECFDISGLQGRHERGFHVGLSRGQRRQVVLSPV